MTDPVENDAAERARCWRHYYAHREYVCTCDPPREGDTGRDIPPAESNRGEVMEHGTRVTRKSTGYTGAIRGAVIDGMAYVRWDRGGGCSVHVDDLAPEDKSWPPAGMETKTPRMETK